MSTNYSILQATAPIFLKHPHGRNQSRTGSMKRAGGGAVFMIPDSVKPTKHPKQSSVDPERQALLVGHYDENENTRLSLGPLNNSSVLNRSNVGSAKRKECTHSNQGVVLRKTENCINEVQLRFLKNQKFSVYSQLKPDDREFQVMTQQQPSLLMSMRHSKMQEPSFGGIRSPKAGMPITSSVAKP